MEYFIGAVILITIILFFVNKSNKHPNASQAKLIYDAAMGAKGDRKLKYAKEYVELFARSEPEETSVVFDHGIDLFSQSVSLDHVDEETKRKLFPFAMEFLAVAEKHRPGAYTGWDEAFMRKRLLGENHNMLLCSQRD